MECSESHFFTNAKLFVHLAPPLHMGWKRPPKSVHAIKQCITWWPKKFLMWNMAMCIHVISGIIWYDQHDYEDNGSVHERSRSIWDVFTYSCIAYYFPLKSSSSDTSKQKHLQQWLLALTNKSDMHTEWIFKRSAMCSTCSIQYPKSNSYQNDCIHTWHVRHQKHSLLEIGAIHFQRSGWWFKNQHWRVAWWMDEGKYWYFCGFHEIQLLGNLSTTACCASTRNESFREFSEEC